MGVYNTFPSHPSALSDMLYKDLYLFLKKMLTVRCKMLVFTHTAEFKTVEDSGCPLYSIRSDN